MRESWLFRCFCICWSIGDCSDWSIPGLCCGLLGCLLALRANLVIIPVTFVFFSSFFFFPSPFVRSNLGMINYNWLANLTSEDVQASNPPTVSPKMRAFFRSPSYMEHYMEHIEGYYILHTAYSPAFTLVLLFSPPIFHLPRLNQRNRMASWSLTWNLNLSVNESACLMQVPISSSIGRGLSAFLLLKICIQHTAVNSCSILVHTVANLRRIDYLVSMDRGGKNHTVLCVSVSCPCPFPLSPVPCLVTAERPWDSPCIEYPTNLSYTLHRSIQVHWFHCTPWSRQPANRGFRIDIYLLDMRDEGKEERVQMYFVDQWYPVWYCSSSWALCCLVCILSIPHTLHCHRTNERSMQRSSLDNCSD